MKKLIVGLMGLMLVGAMALPVAAQGRNWSRDNQATYSRWDNNRRNDFDRRDHHYQMERRWPNDYDNFDRRDNWREHDRQGVRINRFGSLLRLVIRR